MILRKGRLKKEMLEKVAVFASSLKLDRRLAVYDIRQSMAHAKALEKAGIIEEGDREKLIAGLQKIYGRIEKESSYLADGHDDIHMAVESELGDIGKKLHAGRSRNDQVACDMRMYVRDAVKRIAEALDVACEVLKVKALEENGENVFMPFYTHLQRAQAVDLATFLDVYRQWLSRDSQRLKDLYKRANMLPLGSAAGASTAVKLDRKFLARELGFDDIMENPMDAVAARDYLQEFAGHMSIIGVNLSRFAEDLILYSTREFSFIELDESIADTSSIMPQKKNPDCLELIRSSAARLIGTAVNISVLMKGLPLTYNRDMQDDKEIFRAADTAEEIVGLLPDVIKNIRFNAEKMRCAAGEGFTDAADFAEYLVLKKKMDFREAYVKAGQLVRAGIEKGLASLKEFSIEEVRKTVPEAGEDMFEFIDTAESVRRRLHG